MGSWYVSEPAASSEQFGLDDQSLSGRSWAGGDDRSALLSQGFVTE